MATAASRYPHRGCGKRLVERADSLREEETQRNTAEKNLNLEKTKHFACPPLLKLFLSRFLGNRSQTLPFSLSHLAVTLHHWTTADLGLGKPFYSVRNNACFPKVVQTQKVIKMMNLKETKTEKQTDVLLALIQRFTDTLINGNT